MTVQTILDYLWTLAPLSCKESWDNVGFLAGRKDANVTKILVALDATAAVAEEAERFCLDRSHSSRLGYHIALCIEEMAGNTILHGFTKDDKPHHLSVRILHKKKYWVVRFRDDCRAFDPVHYIPREGKDAVGIHLVLALAEDARYTYSMNLNNLSLRLPVDEAPAEAN